MGRGLEMRMDLSLVMTLAVCIINLGGRWQKIRHFRKCQPHIGERSHSLRGPVNHQPWIYTNDWTGNTSFSLKIDQIAVILSPLLGWASHAPHSWWLTFQKSVADQDAIMDSRVIILLRKVHSCCSDIFSKLHCPIMVKVRDAKYYFNFFFNFFFSQDRATDFRTLVAHIWCQKTCLKSGPQTVTKVRLVAM